MIQQQRRRAKAAFRLEVAHRNRRLGSERIASLRAPISRHSGVADQPFLPANAGLEQQRFAVGLQFEDFAEFHVKNFRHPLGNSGEKGIEINTGERLAAQFSQALLLAALALFTFGALEIMNIKKGDDHAVVLTRHSAIRKETQQEPAVVFALEGLFNVGIGCLDLGRQCRKIRVTQLVGDMGQAATDVPFNQVEEVSGVWGEAVDLQLLVEKDGAHLGRGDQVEQVAVGTVEFLELARQLTIDGGEFLIHRLQLFLARLQLFGGGL